MRGEINIIEIDEFYKKEIRLLEEKMYKIILNRKTKQKEIITFIEFERKKYKDNVCIHLK